MVTLTLGVTRGGARCGISFFHRLGSHLSSTQSPQHRWCLRRALLHQTLLLNCLEGHTAYGIAAYGIAAGDLCLRFEVMAFFRERNSDKSNLTDLKEDPRTIRDRLIEEG